MSELQREINRCVGEILTGSLNAPSTGTFNPALVVGIGGTGIKAIRCLKKYLTQRKVNEVKLLGIDSDRHENDDYQEHFPSLDAEDELVILDQATATSALERASRKAETDVHILKYLPQKHEGDAGIHQEVRGKIRDQAGAGQFRRAGKLLFSSNVEAGAGLDSRLQEHRAGTTELQKRMKRIENGIEIKGGTRIYVVCSIAGGQGAGALLDCLALLRKHFNGEKDHITAICLLPGRLIDRRLQNPAAEKPRTRGNALGTLRELQAVNSGQAPKAEFVFGKGNKFKPEGDSLADRVFLLDHATYDGDGASDQLDLARAMGFYLYSFLGSGIGASAKRGEINPDTDAKGPMLGIFGSFGVAALEYPTDAIAEYGLRASLAHWLDMLEGNAKQKKVIEAAVDNLLTIHHLRSPEDVRATLTPDIAELKFHSVKGQEDQLVALDDGDFFSKIAGTRDRLPEELAKQERGIEEHLAATAGALSVAIRKLSLAQLKCGVHSADYFVEIFKERLNALATADAALAGTRSKRLAELDDELKGKASWINKIPAFDKNLKRTYTLKFREYIRERLAAKMDSPSAKYVAGALSVADHFTADLEDLKRTIKTLKTENQQALNSLVETEEASSFIQSRISRKELPAWFASRLATVPGSLELSSLDESALVGTPLQTLIETYKKLIGGLDLLADLREDPKSLSIAVAKLEAASQPLITMVATAPPLEQLLSLKFVAGTVSLEDSTIGKFKPPGQTKVIAVGTGDPRRLICLQEVHGFGAAHWSHFDEAERHYREREWRSHTLPDAEKLPPLKSLAEDRSQALRALGLGMAFGFLDLRQANYYRNLMFSELEECHYYSAFSAEQNAGAKALLEAGLVKMPPKSSARRTKNSTDFLGGSLEEALDKLQTDAEGGFPDMIHEVLGDFAAQAGHTKLGELITGFANDELDKLVAKAQSNPDRQAILRDVQQALRGYVVQLG